MDAYHRKPQEKDCRTGRDCPFCAQLDPDFAKRSPIDRWVQDRSEGSASAHLSENGYVRHLILEIGMRRRHTQALPILAKSA
jgi:hypothetical protein